MIGMIVYACGAGVRVRDDDAGAGQVRDEGVWVMVRVNVKTAMTDGQVR